MSDGPESVKRVNEFYESRYGKEPLKPEGELREHQEEGEAES